MADSCSRSLATTVGRQGPSSPLHPAPRVAGHGRLQQLQRAPGGGAGLVPGVSGHTLKLLQHFLHHRNTDKWSVRRTASKDAAETESNGGAQVPQQVCSTHAGPLLPPLPVAPAAAAHCPSWTGWPARQLLHPAAPARAAHLCLGTERSPGLQLAQLALARLRGCSRLASRLEPLGLACRLPLAALLPLRRRLGIGRRPALAALLPLLRRLGLACRRA